MAGLQVGGAVFWVCFLLFLRNAMILPLAPDKVTHVTLVVGFSVCRWVAVVWGQQVAGCWLGWPLQQRLLWLPWRWRGRAAQAWGSMVGWSMPPGLLLLLLAAVVAAVLLGKKRQWLSCARLTTMARYEAQALWDSSSMVNDVSCCDECVQ
jgi:hypothetical protein